MVEGLAGGFAGVGRLRAFPRPFCGQERRKGYKHHHFLIQCFLLPELHDLEEGKAAVTWAAEQPFIHILRENSRVVLSNRREAVLSKIGYSFTHLLAFTTDQA